MSRLPWGYIALYALVIAAYIFVEGCGGRQCAKEEDVERSGCQDQRCLDCLATPTAVVTTGEALIFDPGKYEELRKLGLLP